MIHRPLLLATLLLLGLMRHEGGGQQVLWREDFSRGPWEAAPAAGVQLATTIEGAGTDAALRLDFDFQGRGGWAAARRLVDLALPENWELRFHIRGRAPANHLEIKFVDPSGENVWWSVRRDFQVPANASLVRVKKRQVSFAWGPSGGGELRLLRALEVTITAGEGGRGTVWLSDVEFRALPPERPYTGTPHASASIAAPGGDASLAIDGKRDTAWVAPAGPSELTVDFGEPRLLGGLTLHWEAGRAPARLAVDVREPDTAWREARSIERGGAARTDLLLPDSEATAVRVRVLDAPQGVALSEVVVRPLAFGESPNAFFEAISAESPRGSFPRGFSGEQQFWTIAGVDGDTEEVLVSEDGAVEVGGYAPALEPFLWTENRLWTWANRRATPTLVDGDLPIPVLTWDQGNVRVQTTVLAAGARDQSTLFVRYQLQGTGRTNVSGRFLLALRPFQANPPSQFLNRTGGVAPITSIRCTSNGVLADDRMVSTSPAPTQCGAATFDQGAITDWIARGEVPDSESAADPFPYASAALAWDFALQPGQTHTIVVAAPLHNTRQPAASPPHPFMAQPRAFEQLFARERSRWRAKLSRISLELPAAAADLAATIRTSLAWILVNRDGPAIQPGSRAYERSWIRDGTLTSAALLRLGHADPARSFAEWFAGFQYADGRVPCCVDKRGADPVPEHDSHGEFIHLVAEVTRFTQDRAFAKRMLPHVERAAAAIDELRSQRRTAEYRTPAKERFFGLLPESISHEGYSAKPMHSYWDSGWGWRGLADARWLAAWLGRHDLATRYAASFAEMGRDLRASLETVRAAHHITYIPGAAELGDFDSTSTTVMVDPVGIAALIGHEPLVATFRRYDAEIRARTEGHREWDAYTPYEVRHIGAYVRLGWRDGAERLVRAFLADRRPPGWNQFPEVVTREMRKPRFLGDLPHGWVASDFIRSALDLFAYARHDDALVLAAGVPAEWVRGGPGVSVRGLRSPWGPIDYKLTGTSRDLTLRVSRLERWPEGGVKAALPLPPGTRTVTVNGRTVNVDHDGLVSLTRLPATVRATVGR